MISANYLIKLIIDVHYYQMIREIPSKGSDSKNLVGLVYQRVTLSIRPTRLSYPCET